MSTAKMSIDTRLALLEQAVQDVREEATFREAAQKEMNDKLDLLLTQYAEHREEMARYKGFLGGVVFLITSIGAFLKFFPTEWLMKLLGGK